MALFLRGGGKGEGRRVIEEKEEDKECRRKVGGRKEKEGRRIRRREKEGKKWKKKGGS